MTKLSIILCIILTITVISDATASEPEVTWIDKLIGAFLTLFGSSEIKLKAEEPMARALSLRDNSDSIVVEADFDSLGPDPSAITFEEVCEGATIKWNNRCVSLLSQGPCLPSEWVVISKTSGLPQCKRRPCSVGDENREECLRMGRSQRQECTEGMRLFWNNLGETECDCFPGWIFWRKDNRCYRAFTQGPCSLKYYLVWKGNQVTCEFNTCQKDGWVPFTDPGRATGRIFFPGNTRDTRCYELNSTGPCGSEGIGMLMVNATTLRLNCEGPQDRPVATTAIISCPAGSRRDAMGTCRKGFGF